MEVLDFLKLRNRLKEEKRKTLKKELGTGNSREVETNLSSVKPKDNYGNFFGPSQTVIAQRVIEESKLLTENPNMAAGVMKSIQIVKKSSMSGASVGSKPQATVEKPKVTINMSQTKVQILKYSRDYSFLFSDDTKVPEPSKDPLTPIVFLPKSEIATSIESSKETLSNNGGNNKVFIGEADKKPRAAATGRIRPTIANERSAEPIRKRSRPTAAVTCSIQKPAPVKKQMLLPPSKPKATISQSNLQPPPRNSVPEKVSDDRQEKKRRRRNNNNNDDDIDIDDPISEIRKMFGYNPRKYADDDDDDNMEANFEDILREEKRSAKIGRKEDEEEYRKIEKERKERSMKKAKKR